MIHYQLRCAAAHSFEGWFPGSAAFEQQAASGLLACPECGDHRVERALMTPSVPRKGREARRTAEALSEPGPAAAKPAETAAAPVALSAPTPTPVAARLPDHLRAALHRLRREVEAHCDYVGPRFAAEARRIHEGESPSRPIYGEATPEQAEALADDGIEVSRIPWLPRADS